MIDWLIDGWEAVGGCSVSPLTLEYTCSAAAAATVLLSLLIGCYGD